MEEYIEIKIHVKMQSDSMAREVLNIETALEECPLDLEFEIVSAEIKDDDQYGKTDG